MPLRDYQNKASDATLREWEDCQSTLVSMPTGTGKTPLCADVIKRRGGRAIFFAHRAELIWQAKDKIQQFTGLGCEVEMGEYKAQQSAGLFKSSDVIVSTVQTQTMGGDGGGRMGKFDPNDFNTMICDEAHHFVSPSCRKLMDYYMTNPNLKVLGVTATPDRADEEALGQVFDSVAFDYEIRDAIKDGWLVPVRQQMVNVSGLDFSKIHTTCGDLNQSELSAVLEAEKNLHSVAHPTIDIIGDDNALVFTASVRQAEMLCSIFNRHRPGSAAWVCGSTDKDERKKINSDFECGDIKVLCNCGTHTEGYDSWMVKHVVMARPTKSRNLYAQMAGRAMRPQPGVVDGPVTAFLRRIKIGLSDKKSCNIIDFVGNSGKHKLQRMTDILGGVVSEELRDRVNSKVAKSGKPANVISALEEEERLAEAEQRRLEESARKANLKVGATYSISSVDPFNVLDVRPTAAKSWDEGKVLSEKQRNFLRKQCIDPDKHNYHQCKQLIGEICARFEKNLCSFKQAKVLKKYGLSAEVTFSQASAAITAIAQAGWRKPKDFVMPDPVAAAPEVYDDVPF